MSDDDIAQMTLVLTAANVVVNIEILNVSKQLLSVAAEHMNLFKDYKEFVMKGDK